MTNQLQIVYAYSISGKPLKQLTHLLLKYHYDISNGSRIIGVDKQTKETNTHTN